MEHEAPGVLVLLNAAAGTLAASQSGGEADVIARGFGRHEIQADVRVLEGAHIGEAARQARDSQYDVIVAGGGDGTLNTVASALIGSGKGFAVLPLGTLNHLAKELNVPLELDAAVDAIARAILRGDVEPLNAGEVNGRPFLLFCAMGFYADVVKHRDAQRKSLGRKKWPAMLVALLKSLSRLPVMRVRIELPDREIRRLTPLLTVALSEHQMSLFGADAHACTGRELLNIFVASRTSAMGTLWMLLRAALRIVRPAKDFEAICVTETRISLRRSHARLGIDGEVIDVETPLRIRLIPGALRVVRCGRATANPAPAQVPHGRSEPLAI